MASRREQCPPAARVAEVATAILRQHIDPDCTGVVISDVGQLTIYVGGLDILIPAAIALRLTHDQPLVDRWSGDVDGILVVLDLNIPRGVFPPRPRRAAA